MRVVQINAVYGVGSTGKIVQNISKELIRCGHESYVMWAITSSHENDGTHVKRIGTWLDHKVHALLWRFGHKQGWHSYLATVRACKAIQVICPDIVHLHNLHSNYIHLPTLLKFLKKHKIPTVITMHDCWFLTGGCTSYLQCQEWKNECECYNRTYPHSAKAKLLLAKKRELFSDFPFLAAVGVSRWITAATEQSILKNAQIINCIYNWIDTETFRPTDNAEELRRRYDIPAHHKVVLGVSQVWSELKGLDEFLQIADSLRETATVVLVGQCESAPARPNIRCVGSITDRKELAALYSMADVFVNPSKAETFGLVTAEAMSCSTPVVAYNNSGSSEIVPASCGVLVRDGDILELIAAVQQVLTSGKEAFAPNCRQWICDNFSLNRQVPKYVELYQRLLRLKQCDKEIGEL